MKVFAIAVLIAAALTGCVVTPYPYSQGPYYGSAAYVPEYQYYWEPSLSLWFYDRGGRRYYQPRGWIHPIHGRDGRGFNHH
jgi:hypothetical protein